MFELYGVLEEGSTAIGVAKVEGRNVLIAVVLAEGLQGKALKTLEEDIKNSIAHPDYTVSNEHKVTLQSEFANVSPNTITAKIQNSDDVPSIVDGVLNQTNCNRIIFTCSDKISYLNACSELGMSKEDFLRFDKLKALLLEEDNVSKTNLSSARQFVKQLNDSRIKISFITDLPHNAAVQIATSATRMNEHVIESEKYFLGNTDDDEISKDEIFVGNYRLPHDRCLFEYDESLKDNGEVFSARTIVLAYQFDDKVACYLNVRCPSLMGHNDFVSYMFGPSWTINEQGRMQEWHSSVVVHPELKNVIPKHILQTVSDNTALRILPFLRDYNEPRSKVITHSSKKTHSKPNTNPPFFKYKTVEINRPRDEENRHVYGNAIEGRKGTALHKVTGHPRVYASGNEIWINAHHRGDPKYGVVAKSFERKNEI